MPFIFGFVFLLLLHGLPSRAQVVDCNPGPWGELRYSKVFLEVPESTLQLFASPPAATMWRARAVRGTCTIMMRSRLFIACS